MAERPTQIDGVAIAGFDAGQSHTTCHLALQQPDGRLRIFGRGKGPGVSHLAAAAGEERFRRALALSLMQARRAATHRYGEREAALPLAAAAVGASGIEQGTDVQRRGEELAAAALGLPAERVRVTGDERTALLGAFGTRPGIVVISGTGCIALGRNGQGREHRCGGWGWQLDRAGSACDIGRDALALSLEMADGRRVDTGLRSALWQVLAQPEITPQRIKALVVEPDFGPAGFARLAPTVNALAAAGDTDARAVLDRSARGLAELVRGVAGALELASVEVCGLGGALGHLPVFAAAYQRELLAALPGARPVPPDGDACQGALLLAGGLAAVGPLNRR